MGTKKDLTTEENKKRKAYWIGFAIAFGISILLCIGTLFSIQASLKLDWEESKWRILTDAFTIPGVLYLMAFLLVKVTDFGAFDAIVYSVRLVWNVTFHSETRKTKLPSNYRDYRLQKAVKERTSASFLLIVAAIYAILTVIFLMIYFANR